MSDAPDDPRPGPGSGPGRTEVRSEPSGRRALSPIVTWALLGGVVLVLILGPFVVWEEPITRWTEGFLASEPGRWSTALVIAALLAGDVLLPVPSSLVSTAAGVRLGLVGGTLVSWIGMSAGCLVGYWLGQRIGRPAAARFVGRASLDQVAAAVDRSGPWALAVFRAVPVLAEASVLFAGLARISMARFLLVTGLANLGISLAYAWVGSTSLQVGSFFLAFAGAVLIPAVAMLLVYRRKTIAPEGRI